MHVKRVSRRSALFASVAAAAALALGDAASAQTVAQAPTPSVFPAVDANGVDLTNGTLTLSENPTSVGQPDAGGLSWAFLDMGARDPLSGSISAILYPDPFHPITYYTVSLGGSSVVFRQDGPNPPDQPHPDKGSEGQSLSFDPSSGTYTYMARDGSTVLFSGSAPVDNQNEWVAGITSITRPDGEVLTYHYESGRQRLDAISSSLGYMIKYEYAAPLSAGTSDSYRLVRVTAFNLSQDACGPLDASCSFTKPWNSISFTGTPTGSGTFTATDSLNRKTTYTLVNNKITQIVRPSGATLSITYDVNGRVYQVSNGFGTWTYTYTPGSNTLQATVTDPLTHTYSVTSDTTTGQILSATDGAGNTTSYTEDTETGRINRVTFPELDYIDYTYDGRGNVKTATHVAKPGSNLPNYVVSATYDPNPACVNFTFVNATCNQPFSVTQGGAETDMTYDPTTGQLLTVTGPAGANGVRPQTRYTYASATASFSDPSGLVSHSAVSKLSTISTCMSQASCAGTADEQKTTFVVDPNNNLLPASVTSAAGDGSESATIAYTYDNFGDVLTVDGPLPGSADIIRLRYDTARQLVGRVEPDPDGPGVGRPPRATRITYTVDGLVFFTQYGTVPSQSDADWASFSKIYTHAFNFDIADRVIQDFINDSTGATLTFTQKSYDNANNLTCSTVRSNAATFTSTPDACTAGAPGPAGPDQITHFTYDAANRVTHQTAGYLTSAPQDVVTAYGPNGEITSVQDGDLNVTTFDYDGFNRISEIEFPSLTTKGGKSTTDHILRSYNPTTWDLSQETERDGVTVVNFTYDGRHNVLSRDQPAATFSYDNLDRLISATASGQVEGVAYDALGRVVSQSDTLGVTSYQYDAANRRTRMTWPDAFYVSYDYDIAGELTAMHENGATSGPGLLASFTYDNLGRRTGVTRGNAANTTYGYDGASRLNSIGHDLPGTTYDQTIGLTYDATGRIYQRTNSNSAYAFTKTTAAQSFTYDNLNRVSALNGVAFQYDGRGNLTSAGDVYQYDAANRMTSGDTGAYAYDALDRLSQETSSGVATRFLYDGQEIIGEYSSSGALLRRFVHGPGADEPLVWYEGAGTTDRRWLLADERGSITAVTNSGGTPTTINTYDEYGVPGTSNQGRFQYTGQPRLADAGVYHYKLREYQPRFGRFLQTDPGGVDAGPNLYAYTGADPMNSRDPSGLQSVSSTVSTLVVPGAPKPPPPNLDPVDKPSYTGPNVELSVGGGQGPRVLYAPAPNEHLYDYAAKVCHQGGKCTMRNVYNCLAANPAPFVSGGSLNTGATARIPTLGQISITFSPQTYTVINSTTSNHFLYPGYVIRTVEMDNNGNIGISNVGYGTGQLGWLNKALAPYVWGYQSLFQIRACLAR